MSDWSGVERRKPALGLRQGVGYVVIAAAVWLGWQIVRAPLADRIPPTLALRLAPGSPEVLRRAAETELAANRPENALALSSESLARAPFNARAMRVRGLAEARLGREDEANELLTLAGNWSLRDDPSHAWLVEHRLRRGDYGSAFAHADTLARRREDVRPQIFKLFTLASISDSKATPVLTRLLAANPSWRTDYLEYLEKDVPSTPLLAALAIALEKTRTPLSTPETQQLYSIWADTGRVAALRIVRENTDRPPLSDLIQNPRFEVPLEKQLYPFGWRLGSGPGIVSSVVEDDRNPDSLALRVDYDGFGSGRFVEQLVLLGPGPAVLRGRSRMEQPSGASRLKWTVTCVGTDIRLASNITQDGVEWRPFSIEFAVPPQQCDAQWVRLEAEPGDRRTTIGAWFDDISLEQR